MKTEERKKKLYLFLDKIRNSVKESTFNSYPQLKRFNTYINYSHTTGEYMLETYPKYTDFEMKYILGKSKEYKDVVDFLLFCMSVAPQKPKEKTYKVILFDETKDGDSRKTTIKKGLSLTDAWAYVSQNDESYNNLLRVIDEKEGIDKTRPKKKVLPVAKMEDLGDLDFDEEDSEEEDEDEDQGVQVDGNKVQIKDEDLDF